MYRSIAVSLALIGLCTQLTACATIFKGSEEEVTFNSDPSGAKVVIDGRPRGKTPTTLTLDSDSSYSVEYRKAGYESGKLHIGKNLGAGWVVLDVLLLPSLIPIVVDAVTGAWYELNEDTVYMELEKVSSVLRREPGSGSSPVAGLP